MMKLKLIPLFLIIGLVPILGACETANRDVPSPPVNQEETPQGGVELNPSEGGSAPSTQEEAPHIPDGKESSPENSDSQSP